MLRSLTSRQLAEWQAFWELEPFGDEWRQAGTTAAAALAPYAKSKLTPDDFLPVTPAPEPQSPEDMLNIFRAMAQ